MTQAIPTHLRPVVYALPGMADVPSQRDIAVPAADGTPLLLDVYRPPQHPAEPHLPGVVFIHGGPVLPERDMKASEQYRSWGALAATSGLVGITFNHRYHAPALLEQLLGDVQAVLDYVRDYGAQLGIDASRLAVWARSGGGPHLSLVLREPRAVRCVVAYYPILDPQAIPYLRDALDAPSLACCSPLALIAAQLLSIPLLVVRAGRDHSMLNGTIDAFVAQVLAQNSPIEVINYAEGQHGFDVADDTPRSRQVIARTLAFLQENL